MGRDLLVAPVLSEGALKRRVYFPKGDAWVDWWTGKRYEGGKDFEIDAPLNRLPLFARAGATIPSQPVAQHTGEMARAPLTLTVISGANNVSRVYEDAGEGYDYRRGASRTLTATVEGNTVRLARAGAYNVSRPLAAIEFLGVAAAPREVRAGGRAVSNTTFDAASGRLVVPLPPEGVPEISLVP